MKRDRISLNQTFPVLTRALMLVAMLAVPLGFASKGQAQGPAFIEDSSTQGGGVGFVLLMSLQRTG